MEKTILQYFEDISRIPRGSGNEKAVSDYLVAFAGERGLWCRQDALWNVVIKKPASPGCEKAPAVLLQGHMDMVCEKNGDTEHDFLKEPVKLRREGEYLRAEGTTLGADNGVALAYMLAALSDPALVHPALECLFTVEEETGLHGAAGIDPALLSARRMINLDCEEEQYVYTGCAGGLRVNLLVPARTEEAAGRALTVKIRGLLGGHSGEEIKKERGNANKLAGRLLHSLQKEMAVRLCSIGGGNKDNAIPRECDFTVIVPEGEADRARELLEAQARVLQKELHYTDAGLRITVESGECRPAFSAGDTEKISTLLHLLPNGVQSWSTVMNLPVSSLNLGRLETTAQGVKFVLSLRSSVDSLKGDMAERIQQLAALLGAQYEELAPYPAWSYSDSPLRERYKKIYRELKGEEPRERATHGGLECGLFSGKLPGMDIIAIGPDIQNAHTPDEALSLPSFQGIWEILKAFLKSLAEE